MSFGIRQTLNLANYNLQCSIRCWEFHVQRKFQSESLPNVLPDKKTEPLPVLRNKMMRIMDWYDEFSGLKEVRIAQDKVVEAGETLAKLQEERRQASSSLAEIQKTLSEIHDKLDNTKRGDSRYLYLVTEEHKLLKEQEIRQEKFKNADNAERDQFIILSNCVKSSHEKERTQAKKVQYWSIIGSITGTIIGIVGTTINNHLKMAELRNLIEESSNKNIKNQLESFFISYGNSNVNMADGSELYNNARKFMEDMWNKLNCRLLNVERTLTNLENASAAAPAGTIELKADGEQAELLTLHFNSLAEEIQRENKELKLIVLGASLFLLLIPTISRLFS